MSKMTNYPAEEEGRALLAVLNESLFSISFSASHKKDI